MTPLRHIRNGPDIDVALCGERDTPIFVRSSKLLTCPTCKAKLAAFVAARSSRPHEQLMARAKTMLATPKDFRRSVR